jgi:4-oxalocrotonate tautomerase
MPYVTIRLTGEKISEQQSATLIRETTDMLVRVLGKNPETTWVLIEELNPQHWGIGGESVAQRLRRDA